MLRFPQETVAGGLPRGSASLFYHLTRIHGGVSSAAAAAVLTIAMLMPIASSRFESLITPRLFLVSYNGVFHLLEFDNWGYGSRSLNAEKDD
jgi:hypothetical protein